MDADIIIVGGSIAGNYLASLLAKQGVRVLVLEEHSKEQIGLPVHCTGIISQKITHLVDFPPDIILNRVKGAAVYAPSGKHVLVGSPRESPVIIDRARFDRHFYEIALGNGAEYATGVHVRGIKILPGCARVYSGQRTYEGNIVVGADGPLSNIASHFGIHHKYIYGVQARVRMQYPDDLTSLHFHPYWRDFFAWIVPEGNGICRVGLGAKTNPNLSFKYFLHQQGISRSQFVSTHGGIIPLGILGPQAFSRAILLGDAAGQVKATTGGGVVMLVSAAQIAARALTKAVEGAQYSSSFLQQEYQFPCEESIGHELKIHYLLHSFLKRLTPGDWDKLIELLRKKVVNSLFSIYGEMDFPKTFLFKLLGNVRVFIQITNILGKNLSIIRDLVKIWRA
jgi:digeranylgeranylglycerophospholipid reductase